MDSHKLYGEKSFSKLNHNPYTKEMSDY